MTTSEPAAIPPQAITDDVVAIARGAADAHGLKISAFYARVILEAAAPHLGDGWDAARDRITEANEARRDERERDAQLAEHHNARVDMGPLVPSAPFADVLREQP